MIRLQTPPVDIRLETRGEVSLGAPDYAKAKVLAVVERLDEPVLAARVKLSQEANHAILKPALAQVVIDLNGRPVRAHVAAATMREAVDLVQERLVARLARIRQHTDPRRHHGIPPAGPGARDGAERRGHRPHHRVRAREDRQIVRHKTYSLSRQAVWAAVLEMEAMDYDFHLFTEAGAGRDSVVYRDEGTGDLRLACAGLAEPEPERGLIVNAARVPELTLAEAVARIDLTGLPFLFFTDVATGRGNVLYHRHDGHFGLITPAR
ncbi:HPF/RaiA family ribosome-associated protein [Kitasatospora herbaricolor]|uniref:ribosome hibernation promotion factor n=1 Tax=Kitasatospora herbaricolor TaxID=68217 RepID=UPI0036DD6344